MRLIWISFIVGIAATACGAGSAPPAGASVVLPSAAIASATPPSAAIDATTSSPRASAEPVWRPIPGTTWQWQLTALPVDLSVDAAVYDLDLFHTDASVVAELHQRGRKVICYLNAGGHEDWRPDAASFPASVVGKPLDGWPGERWLDIRQIDVLGPIMEARLDMCRDKGFDAIEPDNIDGYINDTGFPLTYADQLAFNKWLATEAHERGLSIGLKNDLEQIGDLLADFDWALNEECFAFDECDLLVPFIQAGKAVFHVEYELAAAEFCPRALELRFSSMAKRWDLDAWRETCD